MITWSRSVGTTGEKLAGLLKYAHEAAEYTKSKTGFDIKVEVPIGGKPYARPQDRSIRKSSDL